MKIFQFIILYFLPNFINSQKCGRVKVGSSFIVGSEYAIKGQFPWLAPLYYDDSENFFCGSTIISQRHLLSASHCFKNKGEHITQTPDKVYSLIGIYDLRRKNDPEVIRAQVSSIKIHSDWSSQKETYDADIAILRLAIDLTFTNYIQPACLPPSNFSVFEVDGTVVGYGLSDDTPGEHELRPKFVKISSITQEDCLVGREAVARISSKRMFCAGSVGKNPCRGDSGGGFHVKQGESYYVVGIISSAVVRECGDNEYVLFSNVPKFASWIESILNANDEVDDDWQVEQLTCIFNANKYDDRNECAHDNILSSNSPKLRISSIEGSFTDGGTYNEVDTFIIRHANISYIPDLTVVNQIMPNFVQLLIVVSGLKFVERSKLAKMPQLKVLNFYGNEIEHFDEDVFNDLTNLEILAFVNNNIKILPSKLLWNLNNLQEIWSFNNPIEAIPENFFKNNKKLVKALMQSGKIKKIGVDFQDLPNLEMVDLRENECIDDQACSTCALFIDYLQENINQQCGSESEQLRCVFQYDVDDNRYECLHEHPLNSTLSNVTITSIVGSFNDGKTYNDVDTVLIRQANISYIPDLTYAKQMFPNFIQLLIVISDLKFVERAKLAKLPQLKVLNFYGNRIESFEEDVFSDLKNLEILAFVGNNIKVLKPQLLWNLKNLKKFWSFQNPIQTIPEVLFKNNKKLVEAVMNSGKIRRIDFNFKMLENLKVLDLTSNECIDLKGCNTCELSVGNLQDKIDLQCKFRPRQQHRLM